MKKAYNKTWIENIRIQNLIDTWFFRKSITVEQREAAYQAFPVGFHQSNIFIKIGLFLFTCIVASASLGFISLFLFKRYNLNVLGTTPVINSKISKLKGLW